MMWCVYVDISRSHRGVEDMTCTHSHVSLEDRMCILWWCDLYMLMMWCVYIDVAMLQCRWCNGYTWTLQFAIIAYRTCCVCIDDLICTDWWSVVWRWWFGGYMLMRINMHHYKYKYKYASFARMIHMKWHVISALWFYCNEVPSSVSHACEYHSVAALFCQSVCVFFCHSVVVLCFRSDVVATVLLSFVATVFWCFATTVLLCFVATVLVFSFLRLFPPSSGHRQM